MSANCSPPGFWKHHLDKIGVGGSRMKGARTAKVEFFFAGGCSHCARARDAVREAAQSTPNVEWRETDVGKDPLRAADAGVVGTPAVTIDGNLVFASAPTAAELRNAIETRLREA